MKYLILIVILLTLTISPACTRVAASEPITKVEVQKPVPVAAPLVLSSTNGEPAPTPLTLVWAHIYSPRERYLLCSDPAPKDFCLAETKWWGDCSSSGKGRVLKSGGIEIGEIGKVSFSGCDGYDFLIADSVVTKYNLAADKVMWPRHRHSCTAPDGGESVDVVVLGNVIYFLAARSDNLYVVRQPMPSKAPDDLCELVKASQVTRAKTKFPIRVGIEGVKKLGWLKTEWDIAPLGDLNGDGNLEVILSARIEGGYAPEVAMLASVGDALTQLAVTVHEADLGLHSPERRTVIELQTEYDICEHFHGEISGLIEDAEEDQERIMTLRESCADYRKSLRKARKRYPKNKDLAAFDDAPCEGIR